MLAGILQNTTTSFENPVIKYKREKKKTTTKNKLSETSGKEHQ